MTGAGVVQSASAIGFETLYGSYRWDNPAPQMYYVRNRFLLPQVGTWNRRDPAGYTDDINLYQDSLSSVIVFTDPLGLRGAPTIGPVRQAPTVRPSIRNSPGGRVIPAGSKGVSPFGGPVNEGFSPGPFYLEHPFFGRTPLYQTPNGPSTQPYYFEDYPRGTKYHPGIPLRYDPSTWQHESTVAGKPMVMSAPGWRPQPKCSLPRVFKSPYPCVQGEGNHTTNYNMTPTCGNDDKICWCCEIIFHGALADYAYTILDCAVQYIEDCADDNTYCLPPGTKEGNYHEVP